jgi:hypothetical protein
MRPSNLCLFQVILIVEALKQICFYWPGVNFTNVFCAHFLYESCTLAAFSSQKKNFCTKKRAKNADEIDIADIK